MPDFKDQLIKRMLTSILFTILVALLLLGVGAVLVVTGLLPLESAWYWVCLTWILSTFIGGRISITGKKKVLLSSLLNAVVVVLLLLLLGITDDGKLSMQSGFVFGGCALCGAMIAALFPQRKRRREGRKVRAGR